MKRLVLLCMFLASCEAKSDEPPPRRSTPTPTPTKKPPADSAALSQTYTSKNNLVVVHYPEDFAAQTIGKAVILLSKNLDDGTDEAMSFMSVDKPISPELPEYDRVVHNANTKELHEYKEMSKELAKCVGVSGVLHIGTWTGDNITFVRHECVFLHGGHGYAFSFSFPKKHSELLEMLQRIRDAAELK